MLLGNALLQSGPLDTQTRLSTENHQLWVHLRTCIFQQLDRCFCFPKYLRLPEYSSCNSKRQPPITASSSPPVSPSRPDLTGSRISVPIHTASPSIPRPGAAAPRSPRPSVARSDRGLGSAPVEGINASEQKHRVRFFGGVRVNSGFGTWRHPSYRLGVCSCVLLPFNFKRM